MASIETVENGQSPSLLRQIVDEVDSMNDEEKTALLRKIKMEKTLELAMKVDAIFNSEPVAMTKKAVLAMVSNNRKKWYDEQQQFSH